jgi:hypothetical protein
VTNYLIEYAEELDPRLKTAGAGIEQNTILFCSIRNRQSKFMQ